MVSSHIRTPDCDSQSCSFRFIYFFWRQYLFYNGFPSTGKFWYVVVSASIYFPSNQKCDALFHPIAYDHSYGDWGAFYDHLGDVPREDIFKLSDSTAASGWN